MLHGSPSRAGWFADRSAKRCHGAGEEEGVVDVGLLLGRV